jgi:putative glutamine amidotransferase
MLQDPSATRLALPLIERTMAARMPLLAVCRGLQELNVALGGTLHPRLHEVPGLMDHREDHSADGPISTVPAHR